MPSSLMRMCVIPFNLRLGRFANPFSQLSIDLPKHDYTIVSRLLDFECVLEESVSPYASSLIHFSFAPLM